MYNTLAYLANVLKCCEYNPKVSSIMEVKIIGWVKKLCDIISTLNFKIVKIGVGIFRFYNILEKE
jgi:hypothetical protein